MLTNLSLKAIYDTSENNIMNELIIPLLENSITYQRGVGYFTSSWLQLSAKGLTKLAENEGWAELVTSPYLEENDWHAFRLGDEAKRSEIVYKKLLEQINNLEEVLQSKSIVALAWLIADGFLNIKIAIPKNKKGDFHDKYAIFVDQLGNKVALHGSFNDSEKATFNGEGISVYKSWIEGHADFVEGHQERFNKLFQEQNEYYDVFDIPLAIKEKIMKLRKSEKRPYNMKNTTTYDFSLPSHISLHPFQQKAMEDWSELGYRGLFEMATGTGKTITSLSCAVLLTNREDHITIIISVPFNHLVDQWEEEAIAFGFSPILCRGSSDLWYNKLKSRIQDINLKMRKNLCIICTHTTGSNDKFLSLIETITGKVLFIGDEVHYLGSRKFQKLLHQSFIYRIGLSATPDRWFDEEGTAKIKHYFERTVIEFPLIQAIKEGFLTPYRFIPHPIELNVQEMELYEQLTNKIKKLMFSKDSKEKKELLEKYLRDRAKLLAKAENKMVLFGKLIHDKILTDGLENFSHTIVYCATGETGEVVKQLAQLGLRAHEFIHTVSTERRMEVLKQFDSKDIQVLVAIKCLDEGVNVPATREAYFLANTSNPREFVQRRGRILRKSNGKKEAIVHDFIVIPNQSTHVDVDLAISIIKREMPRFAEFSDGALNEFQAREVMYPYLKQYDLIPLFDKKPWEVYYENKMRGEEVNHGK